MQHRIGRLVIRCEAHVKLKRAASKSLSNIFFDVGTLSGVKHVDFDGLFLRNQYILWKSKTRVFCEHNIENRMLGWGTWKTTESRSGLRHLRYYEISWEKKGRKNTAVDGLISGLVHSIYCRVLRLKKQHITNFDQKLSVQYAT